MIRSNGKHKAFTLIELLIVITIIGVLATIASNFLGGQAGSKSRDAVRISEITQIATIASSLQNRFHTPPISTDERTFYPATCKSNGNLFDCFMDLQVAPENELDEIFTDPKDGISVGSNESAKFSYFYTSTTDGLKVCAYMEDQGAFENINANELGVMQTSGFVPMRDSSYMHCITNGKAISDKALDLTSDRIRGKVSGI